MKLPFELEKVTILRKQKGRVARSIPKRNGAELLLLGVVNLDKPSDLRSVHAGNVIKETFEMTKAGHAGTLDPKVTGVLPIGFGKATKLLGVLSHAGKKYEGVMKVHQDFTKAQLEKSFKKFTGKIKQLPPKISAVKRQVRTREIYDLKIKKIRGRLVHFAVACEAGTYIRKLCLHPQTEIISNPSLVSIQDFFHNPSLVFSMNNGNIEMKYPSETQKFKFSGNLMKITMDSGVDFKITPEHKMLVSTYDGYKMKSAAELTESDYIVKNLDYNLLTHEPIISDLLDDSYLVNQPEIKDEVKKMFINKYGSIRKMHSKIGLDRKAFLKNSKIAIPISHIKKSGIYNEVKTQIRSFKTEKGKPITCSNIDTNMLYLMGLIASDGNNTKEKGTKRFTRIKFHNKDENLINIFTEKYNKLFPDFNLTKTIQKNGLIQLDTSNSFLATICGRLGIRSPQKNSDLYPILRLDKKLVAAFLKGYFDGDGTAYFKDKVTIKGKYSRIDFFTVSQINAKRLHQMLLKLRISSKIFKKKDIYVISINDIASKKRFISIVDTNHPVKKEKFRQIKNLKSRELRDNLYVGFHYKKYIQDKKSKLYKLGGNLNRILNSQIPMNRGFYKQANKLIKLPILDNFSIEKIKNIELTKYSGEVYDMTIPETHNFLIETGFVSSNCHDIGEDMGTGANMTELRRIQSGPLKVKDSISLAKLKMNYRNYVKTRKDNYIQSIITPVEEVVSHLPKVWVNDDVVQPIKNGSPIYVPGIVRLTSNISKGRTIALFDKQNKLLGLGIAKMSAENIMEKEKGKAIQPDLVII